MANPDFASQDQRKSIIDEILAEENTSRKRYEQRKFDIYRNRQDRYVLERLNNEFGPKSTQNMRKVLSINPLPRIIEEQASLYTSEPDRHFSEVSETEEDLLESLYRCGRVDQTMRLANRYYKLFDQAFIYLVPNDGHLCPRVLSPKDLDVIPDSNNPEKAYAYILNVWDVDLRSTYIAPSSTTEGVSYGQNDQRDQSIADDNDRDRAQKRFVVWTNDLHFTMDGNGAIVGEVIANPIGRLPFIDISSEKDFQFFVRRGSSAAEFTIDLLSQLSDLANVSRLQAYSQAVISSSEEPKDIRVGPTKVLWLKQDPNTPQTEPKFEFVSPSPDLAGGLEIINTQLKMFLSSLGLNPSTVSGKNELRSFSSGIDHLLANLDKFQASKQDMDLFRWVEDELFKLIVLWSNVMQPVTGEGELKAELKGPQISDSAKMEIQFKEPMNVQTQSEKEDSVLKMLDAGLMSKTEALMQLRGVDESKAEELLGEMPDALLSNVIAAQDGDQSGASSAAITDQPKAGVIDVRKETLNGAQIDSIVTLATQVGAGNIPKEAAINILAVAFNLDTITAASMLAGNLAAKPIDALGTGEKANDKPL